MIQIRSSCYRLTSTSCSSWQWFVPEEDLDGQQTFKSIIEIESEYMGENFAPRLLIIVGLGMVLHALYKGVPLVIAYGLPVCGKSRSVQIAIALIGEVQNFGGFYECYYLFLISRKNIL